LILGLEKNQVLGLTPEIGTQTQTQTYTHARAHTHTHTHTHKHTGAK